MLNDNKWNSLSFQEKLELAKQHANMPYKEFAALVGGVEETVRRFKVNNKIIGLPQGAQPENKNAEFYGLCSNTIRRLSRQAVLKDGRDVFKCERCNKQNDIEHHPIHHKDRDRTNNNSKNLEVLCKACHAQEHQAELERDDEGRYSQWIS